MVGYIRTISSTLPLSTLHWRLFVSLKAAIQPIKYVLANFFYCVIILILTVNTIGRISGVETRD